VVVKADAEEYEIVDGFHRHELGKGKAALKRRLKGYLPITCLDKFLIDSSGAIALLVYLVIAISQLRMRKILLAQGGEIKLKMWL
ncbi:hypothetical protein MJL33_31595, partial [Salmonella enterica subsp. enterica serovar Kentucky]|nr:hypothetical protein [Salmonella enterica subsp. enterica serovar Kentucky]